MGGDFCSRDPRFTGHFLGSFAAFHATSLMACAITLSLDQHRLAVSLRMPSTLTDRHMPEWSLSGTTRPIRRAIEQYPCVAFPRPFFRSVAQRTQHMLEYCTGLHLVG